MAVSYNAGLQRYILTTEHAGSKEGALGMFDAPEPWGPWTTVEYSNGDWEGFNGSTDSTFYWNFPTKWISADGTSFTMVFTGGNPGPLDSWNTIRGTFTLANQPPPAPSKVVSNLSVASGKPYQVVDDGLVSGAPFFIDRNFTSKSIPATVQGAAYIKTANDDKGRKDASFLSFQPNQDVTVYVAYDHRASSLPDWLKNWNSTGESITTTDVSFKLFARDFAASSTITLGGNLAAGAAGAGSNYFVVVAGQVAPVPPPVEEPQPPIVDAGPDLAITLPALAQLDGTASDDGLPNPPGALSVQWSQVSGPGSASFADPSAPSTTATFPDPGDYVLELTADDGNFSSSDQVAVTVSPAPTQGSAIGHWKFDEATGGQAVDSSGNGNHGTISGASWATGQSGSALSFDGNDDYVEVPTNLWDPNQGTVALWALTRDFSQGNNFFGHTTQPPFENRIQLYTDAGSQSLDLGLGDEHQRHVGVATLQADQWYHMALTWDGTNYKAYVNGQESAKGSYTGLTQLHSAADIGSLGRSTKRAGEALNGLIDEVRVYNRPLSGSEIAVLAKTNSEPVNQAPVVEAGPDQTVTLPAAASLNGTVTDDALPNPPAALSVQWSQVSGPAGVTFGNPATLDTTASFSQDGTYVLRLAADDGALTTSDDLTITVSPEPVNQVPVVDAGPDQTITLPATASLNGTVTDDGLPNPPAAFSVQWSQVSGPSSASFADPSAASTTATFSDPGDYVLELTADDGNFSSSDQVTITVSPPALVLSNLSVASGKPYQVIDDGLIPGAALFIDRDFTFKSIPATVQGAAYIKTANDDKGRKDTSFLSFQVSQDTTVYVAYDQRASSLPDWLRDWNSTGESITTTDVSFKLFARDFAASSTITLGGNLAAGAAGAASNYFVVVADQPVPVPPTTNEAPTADAGQDQSAILNSPVTVSLGGTASDDGLPNPPAAFSVQWSQVSGPASASFADPSAASTTVTFSDPGDYVLKLTADDGELSSSDQVTITVSPPALVLSNLTVASGKPYQVMDDGLVPGAALFIDRDFTFKSILATVQGATYIKTANDKTANDDKGRKDAAFLSFQVNQDVTAYVAYDHRASSLPDWLRDWNSTGESITTTDVSFKLFARDFAANSTITLGGNLAAGAAGAASNYFVVVVGQNSPTPPTTDQGDSPSDNSTGSSPYPLAWEGIIPRSAIGQYGIDFFTSNPVDWSMSNTTRCGGNGCTRWKIGEGPGNTPAVLMDNPAGIIHGLRYVNEPLGNPGKKVARVAVDMYLPSDWQYPEPKSGLKFGLGLWGGDSVGCAAGGCPPSSQTGWTVSLGSISREILSLFIQSQSP